jgi:hypothetical protein
MTQLFLMEQIITYGEIACFAMILCPNIERFLDVGFSPSMDPQNLSLDDEKNLHLESQVSPMKLYCL